MSQKIKKIFAAAGAAALGLPVLAMAQVVTPPITNVDTLKTKLATILGYLYTFLFIAAAFMFIWAAYMYLTAQGDEEKIKKAKNTIIYAMVAVVVALVALGISSFVGSIVGGTVPTIPAVTPL